MATKPGKLATNAAHKAKLSRIEISPYKAEAETIRTAAQAAGQSLQGYILQAVRERMAQDGRRTAPEEPQGAGMVSLPSETIEAVQTAAEAAGMSVNAWIIEAIRDKL